MAKQLQIFWAQMPNISKFPWFQCQAFPRNVLGVSWDFNSLRASKSKSDLLQVFASTRLPDSSPQPTHTIRNETAARRHHSTLCVFPKLNRLLPVQSEWSRRSLVAHASRELRLSCSCRPLHRWTRKARSTAYCCLSSIGCTRGPKRIRALLAADQLRQTVASWHNIYSTVVLLYNTCCCRFSRDSLCPRCVLIYPLKF
jgi:hypothetical protein